MKTVFYLIIVLVVFVSCAFADDIDLTMLTVEQLRTLRTQIDQELESRQSSNDGHIVFEDEDQQLAYVSYELKKIFGSDYLYVNLSWKNKKATEAALCYSSLRFKFYQDGVQLTQRYSADFRHSFGSGVSMQSYVYCDLRNTKSDVELIISNQDNTEFEYYMVFHLK